MNKHSRQTKTKGIHMSKKNNRNETSTKNNTILAKAQNALSSLAGKLPESAAAERSDGDASVQPSGLGWFVAGLGAGAAITWALAPNATQEIYAKLSTLFARMQERISATMSDLNEVYDHTMSKSARDPAPSDVRESADSPPHRNRDNDLAANHSDHAVGHA